MMINNLKKNSYIHIYYHYLRGEIEEKRDATPGVELLRKENERGFVPPDSRGEEGGVIGEDEEERKLIKLPEVRILEGLRRIFGARFSCIAVGDGISLIDKCSGIGIERMREKCSNQVIKSV